MRILLVDDSRKHREAGVADLTALGHEVVAFRDYAEIREVVKNESFDVALLDLLMPAEGMTLGSEGLAHLGEPFAVGYPLAVYLATQGIPFVAVATDTNHHNHPASALMDWFDGTVINISGSYVQFMHAPMKKVAEAWLKDWPRVLEKLLETEK